MHYEKLYVELLSKKEDDRLTILHHFENMAEKDRVIYRLPSNLFE